MKIEHPNTNVNPADRFQPARKPESRTETSVQGDAVRLSGDLQLAGRAFREASVQDDRTAHIARARELYQQGAIGADVYLLADRILDALLDSDGQIA
jgi:hypothetical protein